MTQVAVRPEVAHGGGSPEPPPKARLNVVNQVVSSATTVLAVMLLIFVAEMAIVGPVKHAREQNVLYRELRAQLANATAPTGPVGADGKLVPLGAPVALMRIPSLGLREVVTQGTTSSVLAHGPGHRRDTVLPGQVGTVVILGRQATYSGPFRKIHTLKPGDEIAFATGQGNALYKVTGVRHAGDPAPPVDSTAARLTLITGDGTPYLASEVVRVDAELATPKQPAPAMPATALAPGEAAMAADVTVLLPLLLWSQLLLVLALGLAWVRTTWGRWQSWIVSVPLLGVVGFQVAGLVAQLLPNLL